MFVVIPYQTEHTRTSVPYTTLLLIALNTAVFFSILSAQDEGLIYKFGFIPAQFNIPGIFTSMFLHNGLIHLAGNMLFLWIYGSDLEDRIGGWKLLVIYLTSGLIGNIAHWIFTTQFIGQTAEIPCIGASGAVSGILGLFLIRFFRVKVKFFYIFLLFLYPRWGTFKVNTLFAIGFWFLKQLFYGIVLPGTNIAYWSHIGGFGWGIVGGCLLGAL
jgi:membrane associated rhomboid family serine protease